MNRLTKTVKALRSIVGSSATDKLVHEFCYDLAKSAGALQLTSRKDSDAFETLRMEVKSAALKFLKSSTKN